MRGCETVPMLSEAHKLHELQNKAPTNIFRCKRNDTRHNLGKLKVRKFLSYKASY